VESHVHGFDSVPNFILAFIPAQINRDTLNTMTAFAVRVCGLRPGATSARPDSGRLETKGTHLTFCAAV